VVEIDHLLAPAIIPDVPPEYLVVNVSPPSSETPLKDETLNYWELSNDPLQDFKF
jgi:hypothetical protein